MTSSYRLSQLVSLFGGELLGDDVAVTQVAPLDSAGDGQISFLSNPKYRKQLADCSAAAVILAADVASETTLPRIVAADPYLYFAKVSGLLNPVRLYEAGIHASAVVSAQAQVAPSAVVMGQRK